MCEGDSAGTAEIRVKAAIGRPDRPVPRGRAVGGAGAALEVLPAARYFPRAEEVPTPIVEHVRGHLGLQGGVLLGHDADRTARHHKGLIRDRLGVLAEPEKPRAVARRAIRAAAAAKDNLADLINSSCPDADPTGLTVTIQPRCCLMSVLSTP